jgi:S-formylglutathione hydrolase
MPSTEVHARVWGPAASPTRKTYNPYHLLASRRSDARLSVYADVGTGDYQRIIQMNRNVAAALRTADVDLEYHERPGGHDMSFLDDALGTSLTFLSERFRRATGAPDRDGDARPHDPSSAPALGRPGSMRSQRARSRT